MVRIWPQSLFGRNVVNIAVATALSVTLSFSTLFVLILNSQIDRLTGISAELINTISDAAVQLEPDALDTLLVELDESEFLQIKPLGVTPDIGDYRENLIEKMVMQKIIDRLEYQREMDWRIGENRTLWLNLRIGEDYYWVAAEAATDWTPISWTVLIVSSIILVVTAVGALATRQIAKPLSELREQTDRLSLQAPWPVMEVKGPTEIRALAKSFERMTERLKEAETIRAETLAELSHDLRTPLARLRLIVEMLSGDDDLKSSAARQVEQLDRLIEQFMDVTRDARTERTSEFDLSEFAAEIAQELQIEATLEEGLVLTGQKEMIRRAILNLIENAKKYGQPPVKLGLCRDNGYAVIEVADMGRGFDLCLTQELLKPFKRGQHNGHIAGSGLGLTIVNRVAENHKGHVDFESLEPTGFVARLRLASVIGS